MKRFYKRTSVVAEAGGFVPQLDDKPLRTPGKNPVAVPSQALAEAIAAEWAAQSETIQPLSLPLTRLASTAIDRVAPRRAAVVAEIAKYAGTDLLCYRAEQPPELVARQQKVWQPFLDWAITQYDATLMVTTGILPVEQPEAALRALAAAVEAHDAMTLVALSLATAACGSLVLGLALIEGRIDADAAFTVSQLEESFEIDRWGEDAEQTQRRATLKDDIATAASFIALLR